MTKWLLIAYASGQISWVTPFPDVAACEAKAKSLKWFTTALTQGTRVSADEFEYKCVKRDGVWEIPR